MTEESHSPYGGDPRDASEGCGDSRVDAALRRLAEAQRLPVSDQVAYYEEVHRVLQDTLATIDDA